MKRSRTAKKTSHKGKKFYKGMRSKTMKNKKDFTTKKSSKVFHRKSHYEKHAKVAPQCVALTIRVRKVVMA